MAGGSTSTGSTPSPPVLSGVTSPTWPGSVTPSFAAQTSSNSPAAAWQCSTGATPANATRGPASIARAGESTDSASWQTTPCPPPSRPALMSRPCPRRISFGSSPPTAGMPDWQPTSSLTGKPPVTPTASSTESCRGSKTSSRTATQSPFGFALWGPCGPCNGSTNRVCCRCSKTLSRRSAAGRSGSSRTPGRSTPSSAGGRRGKRDRALPRSTPSSVSPSPRPIPKCGWRWPALFHDSR